MGYKKQIIYHFEAANMYLAITAIGDNYMCIEEMEKNGQEDTHMTGYVTQDKSGNWVWQDGEGGGEAFDIYGYKGASKEILKYINKYGNPK